MPRPSTMTDETKERIRQLAEQGHKPHAIAKLVHRHPATVQWFMYSEGLRVPRQRATARSYVRNGRTVHLFTAEEDRFITARRVAGDRFPAIATAASELFGTQRKPHSIQVRLIMLAGIE